MRSLLSWRRCGSPTRCSRCEPAEHRLEYRAPDEEHGEQADPALLPQEVFYGIAASRYPEVLAREAAAFGVASVLIGAFAAFVVRRRRPE